jgi:hypothetical protein
MPQSADIRVPTVGSILGGSDFIGQTSWGVIFPLQKISHFNRLKS